MIMMTEMTVTIITGIIISALLLPLLGIMDKPKSHIILHENSKYQDEIRLTPLISLK